MVATPIPTLDFHSIDPKSLADAAAATVPEGVLGLSILALVMGIIFRSVEAYPFNQRLLASLASGFVVSILLLLIGIVSVNYVMILAFLTFVAWIMTG